MKFSELLEHLDDLARLAESERFLEFAAALDTLHALAREDRLHCVRRAREFDGDVERFWRGDGWRPRG